MASDLYTAVDTSNSEAWGDAAWDASQPLQGDASYADPQVIYEGVGGSLGSAGAAASSAATVAGNAATALSSTAATAASLPGIVLLVAALVIVMLVERA